MLPVKMAVLIASAILYDVGKLLEYEIDTDDNLITGRMGKVVRHTFSGAGLVMMFGLPPEVIHAIGYHSKEGELAKRTPEGTSFTMWIS